LTIPFPQREGPVLVCEGDWLWVGVLVGVFVAVCVGEFVQLDDAVMVTDLETVFD